MATQLLATNKTYASVDDWHQSKKATCLQFVSMVV